MRGVDPVARRHDGRGEDWLDRFFAAYYARRPVNATFIGVHAHDRRLPDFTEAGEADAVAEMEQLLAAAPPEEPGSGPLGMDVAVARGFLEIQLWEARSAHFQGGNPSTWVGEAVFGVLGLFLTEYGPLAPRLEAAVARMRAFDRFLAAAPGRIRSAPRPWTTRALRECRGGLALLEDGLGRLAAERGFTHPAFDRARADAARGLKRFAAWLDQDLKERPIASVACGSDALDLYLNRGHFLDQGAEEIAAWAEDERAEAEGLLAAAARRLGAPNPEQALERLQEVRPTAGTYLGRYGQIWERMREVAEAHDLLTWPEFPLRYVPRPAWTRQAAPDLYFLFYRSPAAMGRPPVHDYLVTPIDQEMPRERRDDLLRSHNDAVIKLNHVIHHGGIGHHVQNWHAFRAESRVGRMAAVDCASRIAMFAGGTMAEGWACYATDLMTEVGALTALEECAELQARRRMAARAVVDVGLHTGRLTLAQAAEYYRESAGLPPTAAMAEAVKNSMFPGTALMYLVGTDAIHRLRRRMSRLQGPSFSLRAFHDRFLSYGSLPVTLIARDMTRPAEEPRC